MKILLVSSEVAPFAKTGGLADVAGALPLALRRLGHDVRIFMPWYRDVEQKGLKTEVLPAQVEVSIDGSVQVGRLRQGQLEEIPVYFLDHPGYFQRDGLYGSAEGDHPDNDLRFGFFCRALLEALPAVDFRPDVLHLNDWQAGLIPVLLQSEKKADPFFASMATVFTIHNLGYQGLFPATALGRLGLDPALFHMEGLEYYGSMSFLKGGIFFSDLITTVSPTYCREIQTSEYGHGFEGILTKRRKDLHGILNGIDTGIWNPAADEALAAPFSAETLAGKAANKKALQKELGLSVDPRVPVMAMIGRLATQKGLDILEAAWPKLVSRPLQFVLLGSGEERHVEFFRTVKDLHPAKISIHIGFDDALARRIYAGSDLFLMPSHYEPCGLGQLIALRYGSLPLVRSTGGLADTVHDVDRERDRGNGFVFRKASAGALMRALDRALDLYGDQRLWKQVVRRGMSLDLSWDESARRYLEIYRQAADRKGN
ncbi:MAG: glycogen synthase GlgA [Syntrophotaleaceae bacterium]